MAPQTKQIEFDGVVHQFPADFTDEDIRKALSTYGKKQPTASTATVSAKPPLLSAAGLKEAGYNTLDKIINELPTIGGLGGAIALSESGPGAVAGAGAGGVFGESVRQLLRHSLGWETPQEHTPKAAATGIAEEGAGQALSEATGRAGSRLLKPAREYFARTAARSTRLPLLPSQAGVGGSRSRVMEGFLAHTLPSQGMMEAFRKKQVEKAAAIAEEEAARLSKFSGTPEQAGTLTKKSLEQSRKRVKKEVDAAYKAIDQLTESQTKRVPKMVEQTSSLVDESGKPMTFTKKVLEKKTVGGVQPSTRPLKMVAVELLKQIRMQKQLLDPKLIADSESILTHIIKAPDNVPYRSMADTRSDLLAIGRKLDEVLPGKRAGIAKLLAGTADQSMMEAAERSGISGLPEQVRAANALNREMHRKFEQPLITKIMETGRAEDVSSYVRGSGLQELRDMNALLTNPQRRLVQSQVVRELFSESLDKETHAFEPQKFAQAFQKLGDERGKELFGGNYDNIRQISDLFNRAGALGHSGGLASLHNWAYVKALPTAVGALLLSGRPETAAGLIGTVGAEAVFVRQLAKAVTNPAKSARAVEIMQAATRGAPWAVNAMAHLLSDDPPPPAKTTKKSASQQIKDLHAIANRTSSNPNLPVGEQQ